MKITQEVRDFAPRQNQPADAFIAANPPRNGEGNHSPLPANGGGTAALAAEDAEAGMAQMSEKLHEKGGETYLRTAE